MENRILFFPHVKTIYCSLGNHQSDIVHV